MIIPQFIRFYGYTVQEVMNEYAITFFSLVNSMSRIGADEMLENIYVNSVTNMERKDAENAIEQIKKKSRGLHGLVEEVKTARKFKK